MSSLATVAKKFFVDAIESFLGIALGLSFALPTSLADGSAIAFALYGALLAACVSALRRNTPGFVIALREALGVPAG